MIHSQVFLLKEAITEELKKLEQKIFGLIIFFTQEELSIYLDHQKKEKLDLQEAADQGIPLNYNHELPPYDIIPI